MTGTSTRKQHICCFCEKNFCRPFSLRRHMVTHTGETPFRCDFPGCTKQFNTSGNLSRHKRIHKKDAKKKPTKKRPISGVSSPISVESVQDPPLSSDFDVDFIWTTFERQLPLLSEVEHLPIENEPLPIEDDFSIIPMDDADINQQIWAILNYAQLDNATLLHLRTMIQHAYQFVCFKAQLDIKNNEIANILLGKKNSSLLLCAVQYEKSALLAQAMYKNLGILLQKLLHALDTDNFSSPISLVNNRQLILSSLHEAQSSANECAIKEKDAEFSMNVLDQFMSLDETNSRNADIENFDHEDS